jgi:WD40 repeat protein
LYFFEHWREDIRGPTAAWLSDDGIWGAAGYDDGKVEFAGIATKSSTVPAGRGPISALAFHPDGGAVATAGLDGSVYVWEKPGPEDAVVLAEGETVEAPAPLASFPHAAPVHSIAWGGGTHPVVTGSEDGKVRAWNPSVPETPIELLHLDAPALSVATTPDGVVVAAGGADGSVRLLLAEGDGAAAGDPRRVVDLHQGEHPVEALAVTPDGSVVVGVAAGGVWFWSSDGRHVRYEDMGRPSRRSDVLTVGPPAAIRLDWRGLFVQVRRPGDGELRRWPLQVPVQSLLDSIPGVTGARFLADGGGVAVGLPDGGVRTYSFAGELVEAVGGVDPAESGPTPTTVSGVATSRDGRWRAQAVGTEVRLTAAGDSLVTPLVHEHEVGQIVFSEDGSRLLAMPRDGLYASATIWTLDPTVSSATFSFSQERDVLWHDELESEWVNPTNRGGLNADGSKVWTAVSEQDGRAWHVTVRDVETLEPVVDDFYFLVACVSLSPDGRWALVCHEDIDFRSALHLWDLATGARQDLSGAGHPCCWEATQPLGGDFSSDGTQLMTWAADGSAVLHRLDVPADALVVNGGVTVTAPDESRSALVGARMSPDQQLAVTVSQDGRIELWPLAWEPLVKELRNRSVACLTAPERIRLLAEPLATADSAVAACEARYRR